MTQEERLLYTFQWLLPLDPRDWSELLKTHFFLRPRHVYTMKLFASSLPTRDPEEKLSGDMRNLRPLFTDDAYTSFTQQVLEDYPNFFPWTERIKRPLYDPNDLLTQEKVDPYDRMVAELVLASS